MIWLGQSKGCRIQEVKALIKRLANSGYENSLATAGSSPGLQAVWPPKAGREIWFHSIDFSREAGLSEPGSFRRSFLLKQLWFCVAGSNRPFCQWDELVFCSSFLMESNLSLKLKAAQTHRHQSSNVEFSLGPSPLAINLAQGLLEYSTSKPADQLHVTELVQRVTGSTKGLQNASEVMMNLLQVAWPLKAGDERDKVFALLGIANEIAHRGLRPFPLKVDMV
jgi:hypothetical protein